MTTVETVPKQVFGDIVFEDIPDAPPRPPGKGREPVKWEDHLSPLESKLLNKPARLWAYETKTGAVSRMSAVKGRLNDVAPTKNWEFKVRPVPNTDPSLWGVYAVFHGEYTPDQVLANAQARQNRRDALAGSRGKNKGGVDGTATPPVSTPENDVPATMTPKERLAAQAAAKK